MSPHRWRRGQWAVCHCEKAPVGTDPLPVARHSATAWLRGDAVLHECPTAEQVPAPPRPPREPTTAIVYRVTARELAALEAAADRDGDPSPALWARQAALHLAGAAKHPGAWKQEVLDQATGKKRRNGRGRRTA